VLGVPSPIGAAVALCLIVGCAVTAAYGESGPTDKQQIASVLQRTATSPDVKVHCETAVSRRFVRDVYGTSERCRLLNTPDPDGELPIGLRVTQTRLDGDRATSRISFRLAGVSGSVALVRIDGVWKLDRFGDDLLRSAIEHLAAGQERACLARATRTHSTDFLRDAGNASFGARFGDVPDVLFACLPK
jgi:hypothetical protein